ncbi:MAG: LamG domain-containing protein, partial [Limisphaerales bacterium]
LYSGQQKDMSVTASSDTNGLVYQWYVNGSPDPNGTNSTYETAPQATAGNQFYCIVANSSGSATSMTVSVSQVLGIPAVLTNSLFSSNILAAGPTAFWPMNETGETPAPGDLETNLGAWGATANGIYGDWRSTMQSAMGINQAGNFNAPTNMTILHGIPGAIAGDTDPSECFFASDGSEIVIPHSSPGLTLTPPFTLEAWLRPNFNSPGFGVAIGEHSGAFNATGNAGGFDWIYNGTSNTFSMPIFSGNGGADSEPKTSANYPPGQWYHVVTTYDGTNVQYYIDGVADPMTGVNGTNGAYAKMAPNYWDPITIGCGRGIGANDWRGSMDEVAIYTNYLMPPAVIQAHYQDGTNAAYHNYKQDVLSLNPALYLRMDAPVWTPPPTSTWPTLTNYGSVAINGVYTPNAVPSSGPAPSDDGVPLAGFPANSSFQSDGVMAFGDALNDPAFHPTGK